MLTAADFFDLNATAHAALFEGTEYVWEGLPRLLDYIAELLATTHAPNIQQIDFPQGIYLEGEDIYIGEGTVIEAGAYIQGPAVIEAGCTIRHGAFIRGGALLAEGSVVGHATEIKHAALLENAHAPHFAYVGDSILGRNVNLGAGTKLSNLPVNSEKDANGKRPTIRFSYDGQAYDTGLAKLGAILGDDAQTGCNAVLNPGCIIGAGTWIYPLVSLGKGYYPPRKIIKLRQTLEVVERQ